MSELWALLHFIMPDLFDSHEQCQDWFSKDIEAHSQDKGELNQEQLKRLHQILQPFMLRRVKKDVEHEIGPKKEYEILCYMTEKQKILYNSIKQKLNNISDLFMSTDSKLKVTNLMNLVIQFRKVCNHPELFERNIGKVPFTFKNLIDDLGAGSLFTILNGEQYLRINEYPSINYVIPKMIYDLCYDKYDIKKYISKKMIICDDVNFEDKYTIGYINDIKSFNSFLIYFIYLICLYIN
jgi:DNA helicase INO80